MKKKNTEYMNIIWRGELFFFLFLFSRQTEIKFLNSLFEIKYLFIKKKERKKKGGK